MISFGSNYRFNIGLNYPNHVMNRLANYAVKGVEVAENFSSFEETMKTGVCESVTVTAPNKYDTEIEILLLTRGIDFNKQTFDEALNLDNIKNRIELSGLDKKFGNKLVEFDTDVLDELFKKDGLSYIEPNGRNGVGTKYQGVGEYLKSGKNINATKVCFFEQDGELSASVIDGRHRFAYMRDLGMEGIPISIDKNSYKIAQKYGLIK